MHGCGHNARWGITKWRAPHFSCAAALMLCSVVPAKADRLQDFTQVPYVYTQSPWLFRNVLLDLHATPTRIAFFGDSTAYDQLGAGGSHMNWRRWLWHQHFGHTPGTQMCR